MLLAVSATPALGGKVRGSDGKSGDVVRVPRLQTTSSVVPKLKLRKRLRARGQSFTVGCDYNVPDRSASFEASWRDSKIGGRLTLKNLDQLEWTKTWIMPGELRSNAVTEL